MTEPDVMPVCRCGHSTHQHKDKAGKCSGGHSMCPCREFRRLPGHEKKWNAADLISPHFRTRARE